MTEIPLITTTVSALPPGPQRLGAVDSATFVAAADAWNTALEDDLQPELAAVVTEINATAEAINTVAAEIDAVAQTVDGLQNFKGPWASLTGALATPASVSHSGKVWVLAAGVADVTAHTPGVSASWIDMTPTPQPVLPLQIDSANVTFASSPSGGIVRAAVALGSQYEMLFVGGGSSTHAVVWDKVGKVFGPPVLVRSASWGQPLHGAAVAISGTQVVLVTCPGTTALEAVCLTISGTTITVGTAATATLGGNLSAFNDLQIVGSSVVMTYSRATSTECIRALTVSGSTVTLGTESALSGTSGGSYLHPVNSSVVLAVSANPNLYARPYSVSGSTLTAGTEASTPGSLVRQTALLSTGRWYALYDNTTLHGAVISVSGTTATISAVTLSSGGYVAGWPVPGGRVVVQGSTQHNVLTDSAGTAVAGTPLTANHGTNGAWVCGFLSDALVIHQSNMLIRLGAAGNEPDLSIIGMQPSNAAAGSTPYASCSGVNAKALWPVYGLTTGDAAVALSLSGAVATHVYTNTGATRYDAPRVPTLFFGRISASIGWGSAYASQSLATLLLTRMELTA